MTSTIDGNDVTARYLGAQAATRPKDKATANVPPGAIKLLGDPKVTVVTPNGAQVHFYVVTPTLLRARGVVVNDIYKVSVLHISAPRVRRYPKPVSLTEKHGPGAPILWKSSKDIPDYVKDALRDSLENGLLDRVEPYRRPNVVKALSRLGIDSPVLQDAKIGAGPITR
ncbi:MAG: hypothetical protein U0R17_03640 [Acidimicrobiia bacterium]